jgi:hypothetical protein
MTHADLIEHVLPVVAAAAPSDPARAFRAHMTWWLRWSLRARVSA